MLIKEELKKVPPCECPEFTKKVLGDAEYVASAKVVNLQRSRNILVADYFNTNGFNLQVRFFSDGQNYISYLVEKDEWTEKALTTIFEDEDNKRIPSTQKSGEIAADFLGIGQAPWKGGYSIGWYRVITGLYGVCCRFICDKHREKCERYLANKEARKRKHISMFPDYLPASVDHWIDDKVLDTYIFFSKLNKGRRRTGTCGHCGKKFPLPAKIKHKQKTVCPKCGKNALYCAERFTESCKDEITVCYPLKHENQLLLDFCKFERSYNGLKRPVFKRHSFAKTLYLNKNGQQIIQSYGFRYLPYYYSYDWWDWGHTPVYRKAYVYPYDLDVIFGKSYYNVNLKECFLKNTIEFDFVRILDNLKNYANVEYLLKSDLVRFADSTCLNILNTDGKSFQQVFGVDANYRSMYAKCGVTMKEHQIIENAKEHVTEDLLERYRQSEVMKKGDLDTTLDLLECMSLTSLINHADKYFVQYGKEWGYHILTWMRDYIDMSRNLGVHINKKNMFPADIKKAHDILLPRWKDYQNEIKEKQSKKALEYVNRIFTGFKKDGYMVKVPQKRSDFIREGQELSHCVGMERYYTNHVAGSKMIFFIRKADDPDKAFFTTEIDMATFHVIQLYGYGDCIAPKDVKAFTNSFAQSLKRRINIKEAV